ncbi:lkhA, partial [Symbiodinium sp. KB8]
MSADSSTDKHTLSNYEEVSVVHADFAWAVDFEASVLRGSVEYTFGVEDGAEIDTIVLDTNHLNITGVAVMLDEETGGWTERHMDFVVEEPVACFGSALRIPLPETWTDEGRLRIEYETTKDSQALQWLTAEQTKDKQQPFLFTQCQ